MGTTQALVLPKEYKIELPSKAAPVAMRKLTGRDQVIAGANNDPESTRYALELIRLVTVVPGSIGNDAPAGVTAFTQESVLDLDIEDITYLTEAMTALNGMGANKKKYAFNF